MSDSAQPSEGDGSIYQTTATQKRQCDFCGESTALLYCRADSAKLCLSCDREVHSTNQLFTKHIRNQLCDACDSAAASIFCSTENAVLCNNCDWERHSSSQSTLHERRPLEGFTGCPSVNEILGFVGFEDLSKKALIGGGDEFGGSLGLGFGSDVGSEGYSDLFVWDTPAVVSLDDLILPDSSQHNFQAMGVPPLPKNRNAACGQYKEEMLKQLREMAISEPNVNDGQEDFETLMQFRSPVNEQDLQLRDTCVRPNPIRELAAVRPSKASAPPWGGDRLGFVESCLVPDKESDFGGGGPSNSYNFHEGESHLCNATEATKDLPKVVARELTSEERDYAISRYKEKKKTRRFEKQVRYESRKIRAESRTRIKGRFAKVNK